MLLKCSSRPETPKILVITAKFGSKNCFLLDFAIKTVCFCDFAPEFMQIRAFLRYRPFFFFFGLHLRFGGNLRTCWGEDQNLWIFAHFVKMKTFFLWSSPQILKKFAYFKYEDLFFGLYSRFCRILRWTPLFCLVHTLEFTKLKFLCPLKICLYPPVTLSWRRAWKVCVW